MLLNLLTIAFLFGVCSCALIQKRDRENQDSPPERTPTFNPEFKGIDLSDQSLFPCSKESLEGLDAAFDRNFSEDVLDTIKSLISKHQLVFLGQTSHNTYTAYDLIEKVLKSGDVKLDYIILERTSDPSDLYPRLSNHGFDSVLSSFNWSSDHQREVALCVSSEWQNSITRFMSEISQINNFNERKISVLSLDGASTSDFGIDSPRYLEIASLKAESNCSPTGEAPFRFSKENSPVREQQSASNFERFIRESLEDGKRALVLYHQAHLLRKGNSCTILKNDDGSFVAKQGPSSFLARIWTDDLAAKSVNVFLDEPGTGYAPKGNTRLAARQGTRKPGKSFILEVKTISELEEFIGADQFMPGSSIGGVVSSFQGKPKLRENFDWIVWASNDLASGLKKVEIPGCR